MTAQVAQVPLEIHRGDRMDSLIARGPAGFRDWLIETNRIKIIGDEVKKDGN